MRTSFFLVGLWLGAGAVGCGSSDAGGGSAGASGSSAQAGASGSAGASSAAAGSSSAGSSSAGSSSAGSSSAGSSSAGSSSAGASGATAMGSAACQKYCACHEMNCASTAIPGGKSCADFCATMTPEQLACRQNMCTLAPVQPDNNHCTHSVGIMQCICDGTPGSC